MTSRWLDQVATLRNIEVSWHVMSLAVLNENATDLSEGYRNFLPRGSATRTWSRQSLSCMARPR